MPQQITSRSNSWFRRFRSAIEEHDREIVLEGPKQIADALGLGWNPLALAADREERSEDALVFSSGLFRELSDTVHSQGMLALFERPPSDTAAILRSAGAVVILDGVQDPGNVGTIVRLAAAFEASGVVLTEGCADPWSPKAIRASAGTVLILPVAPTTRQEVLQMAREGHRRLFAAMRSERATLDRMPLEGGYLVLGSEGRGVSDEFLKAAEEISIPISSRVESINVAAAAAILLAGWFATKR